MHVLLPGEGSFHQYHGGVTTGGKQGKDRDDLMKAIVAQYRELRGEAYTSPQTVPIYLGEISQHAQKFVLHSSNSVLAELREKQEFEPKIKSLGQ